MTEMIVFGGQNGYIPIKDNSHGGVDLGHALNGLHVFVLDGEPEEYGYVQVDQRIIQDSAALGETVKVSVSTGQYWLEKTHLQGLPPTPPPVTDGLLQVTGIAVELAPFAIYLKVKKV